MSIPEEYTGIRKVGFNPPHIAYFVSRFATLGFCVSCTAFRIAPIANCAFLKYIEGIFFEIAVPATSLLFFFRVKAVYNQSRIITAFFGFIWLAIAGLSILIMLGITGDRIPYTQRCTEGLAHTYTTVPIILTAVNDTLVFLAISYRLVSLSMVNSTWSSRARSFIGGDGLHHLSKALLQSGQAYYFVTIGVAIISSALILSRSVPSELHAMLGPAYFALSSAMACRVFRAVLLGIISDSGLVNTPAVKIASFTRTTATDPLESDDYENATGRSSKLRVNVAVEMNTRTDTDDHTFWEQKMTEDHVRQDASHQV